MAVKRRISTATGITEKEFKELRNNFTKLTLENPNYFGNIKNCKTEAAVMMAQNTSYEDIGEVGYNPYHEVLYCIINVKSSNGYAGTLCSKGSNEYVRFYADFDSDGDFTGAGEDMGVASVNVHDIPGAKPLKYCVSVKIDPAMKQCTVPYLVKVRAVLSWNAVPPPNAPDHTPVWGETQDTWIQIKPQMLKLKDVIAYSKVKINSDILKYIDTDQAVEKAVVYSKEELKVLYKDLKVEEHRFDTGEVASFAEMLSKDASLAGSNYGLPAAQMQIPENLKKAIQLAVSSPADTGYEVLKNAGLQYDTDSLTAVVRIKRPYGYSGGLCSKGSYEYVAFFADWNNDGTFDCYLGTASLNVHDIPSIPANGLDYAMSLPVNMTALKKKCAFPQVFKIRAILSWNVLPAHDPNYIPVWGNSLDVYVQLKPGLPVTSEEKIPFISVVGDMAVTNINYSGYATGTAVMSGFQAKNSPFGGWVVISGHISNPPDLSAGEANLRYYVSYRKAGEPYWTKIVNKFQITISQWDGYDWTQYQQDQAADSVGCYLYREDLAVNPPSDVTQRFVEGFVMSKWYTGGLADGLYEIKVTLKDASGDIDSNIVHLQLDNTAPAADVTITEIIKGGVSSPAKPCGVFKKNVIIKGKFSATDNNFLRYIFTVEPSILSPNPVNPASGIYPAITGAVDNDWELDTTGMQICGYVIHLHVYDRTIVNSGYIGWYNKATVGFCLNE